MHPKNSNLDRTCVQCGIIFQVDYPSQKHRHCSPSCLKRAQSQRFNQQIEMPCAHCGAPRRVPPSKVRAYQNHFCNQACCTAYQTEHPYQRLGVPSKRRDWSKCIECGIEFRRRRTKYPEFCSQNCQHRSIRIEKHCGSCGDSFSVSPTKKDKGFCSAGCYEASIKGEYPAIPCNRCGKQFRRTHPGRKYCCEECRRPPLVLNCAECGEGFRCVPAYSRYRAGRSSRRFCSFACYRKHTGETAPERTVRLCLESLGLSFVQEYQVKTFSIDFYLPSFSLGIEVDEPYWHDPIKGKDSRRDNVLARLGYRIVRLDATPFYGATTEAMVEIVRDAITEHGASPHCQTVAETNRPTSETVYIQKSLLA